MEPFTRIVNGDMELPAAADDAAAGSDSPRVMVDVMAVRTRFFDDFFAKAADAGIRQAVILASGLDARAYRLPWPAGTVVYEVDQPQVIEFKGRTLAEHGAEPTAELAPVSIDLRDDWPAALRRSGFDTSRPTAWSAEGLLAYLPPEAQDRLFDNITELSAPGSRLATEYHPDGGASIAERSRAISSGWRDFGFDINLSDLFYTGDRHPAGDYLSDRGWEITGRRRPEVFADYGRRYPDTDTFAAMRDSLSIIATLT
jgi:methyltransferase (TIGR00027 family)